MTTFAEVIKAAIPNADGDLCERILWERTPYPMGRVSAKSLYQAASRFKRANENKRRLCDCCHNQTENDKWTCAKCSAALEKASAQ